MQPGTEAISGGARLQALAARAAGVGRGRVALALPAIVVAAVVVWGLAAISVASPWIYVDELIYSDLAKSIAAGGPPAVRGVTSYGYGLVYPLLVWPAWVLARDPGRAYVLARAINAVVMCSAALPAFLLARRFVARRSALVVAALTVAVPSMVYVTAIMTEVGFYPAFLLAVLAVQRALERPSARRQILALAAIGLAAATKILAIGLLPAYVVAAFLLAGGSGRDDGGLVRARAAFRSIRVVLAAVAAGLLLLGVVRGASPLALFGAYSGAVSHVAWTALPLAIARHGAVLLLYTAVVPVVATAVVVGLGLRRHADPTTRAFAALVLPTVAAITGGVAVFSVYASGLDYQKTGVPSAVPVYERNLFVVVPLLLIGLARWIELGCPRPRWTMRVVSVGAVALVALYPWSHVARKSANPQNLATFPWVLTPLSNRVLTVVVALVAVALVALWRGAVPETARRLWYVVGSWFVLTALLAFAIFFGTAAQSSRDGVGVTPTWIDRAVGSSGRVEIVWPERPGTAFAKPSSRQRVVWASEFFNRSVVGVVSLGAKLPFGLPDPLVRRGPAGVLLDAAGRPLRAEYVLAPCSLPIDAPVVAVDPRVRAAVYRTAGEVRVGGPPVCPRPGGGR